MPHSWEPFSSNARNNGMRIIFQIANRKLHAFCEFTQNKLPFNATFNHNNTIGNVELNVAFFTYYYCFHLIADTKFHFVQFVVRSLLVFFARPFHMLHCELEISLNHMILIFRFRVFCIRSTMTVAICTKAKPKSKQLM